MDYAAWRLQLAKEWAELQRHGTPFWRAAFLRGVANRLDQMGFPKKAVVFRTRARKEMEDKAWEMNTIASADADSTHVGDASTNAPPTPSQTTTT